MRCIKMSLKENTNQKVNIGGCQEENKTKEIYFCSSQISLAPFES